MVASCQLRRTMLNGAFLDLANGFMLTDSGVCFYRTYMLLRGSRFYYTSDHLRVRWKEGKKHFSGVVPTIFRWSLSRASLARILGITSHSLHSHFSPYCHSPVYTTILTLVSHSHFSPNCPTPYHQHSFYPLVHPVLHLHSLC